MQFVLEKYSGLKSRYPCPACGERAVFVRYKDETGEYLANDVGRCNRQSKCGYHKKPKDYFAENPQTSDSRKKRKKTKSAQSAHPYAYARAKNESAEKPDYIERGYLLRTLTNYEQNSFVGFLLDLVNEDTEIVEKSVKDYLIGTTRDGKTIFWQIDESGNVRTGKIIAYDRKIGKRRKDIFPNWIHSELKRIGKLKDDFNLKQCFFGEHLLRNEKEKPAAIVEAEKTAVIASICFPEFVWLAVGAKHNLNPERLTRLGKRKIILYPDADSFILWQEIALQARLRGANVDVSNLLETHATDQQKASGFDLADYLIDEQTRINEYNRFADDYNQKVEKVLHDENLFREFNHALDAQKANLILYSGLSEPEAERRISDSTNIRQTVSKCLRANLK